MRAIILNSTRSLSIEEIAAPLAPKAHEVTIAIKYVALNHLDVWGWRGMAFAKRSLPLVIGAEAAGEIIAIGNEVNNLNIGQLVTIYGAAFCGKCAVCQAGQENLCDNIDGIYGFHKNGFATEFVNIPARLAIAAPAGCDAIAAAVAPITFGTAEHMLFDNANLQDGETILIHAAGSGVGSAAIQLAKLARAYVFTTVGSASKEKKALNLAANCVINYNIDRFENVVRKKTNKQGVDVVFEHVGKTSWAASMLCLKKGGRLVSCGSTTGISAEINLMQLFQRQLRIYGSFGCNIQNIRNVMQKFSNHDIVPIIDTIIDMNEISQSLKRLEDRDVFGKIILKI